MEYWEELLDYANNDLNASKLLYENNDYRNAIYHLQQANEKTAKSCLAKIGMIKNDAMASEFGHAWHNTLMRLAQELMTLVQNIEINPIEAELIKFLSGKTNPSPTNEEIVELCKSLQQFIEQLSNPDSNTKNEINQKLDKYKNILSEQNILKLFDNFNDQSWYQFFPKEAKEAVKSLPEAKKKEFEAKKKEFIKEALAEKGGDLYDYAKKNIFGFYLLIPMALLSNYLVDHEQLARYPNKINYADHPLKTNYKEITAITKSLIEKVKTTSFNSP